MTALHRYDDADLDAGREGVGLPLRIQDFHGGDLVLPPETAGRSTVSVNFVVRRDGVVNIPEDPGGKAINGGCEGDIAMMAVLRATHDAVLVGSETLASEPHHLWTASYIYPPFGEELEAWRGARGMPRQPLNIIVTRSGLVRDLGDTKRPLGWDYPVFQTAGLAALVVTTGAGAAALLSTGPLPANVSMLQIDAEDFEHEMLVNLLAQFQVRHLLVEGGPTVNGALHAKKLVTDDFLTLAPGMAGRTEDSNRATLMMGYAFPPDALPMPTLVSVRRAGDHLLIRERYTH